MEAAHYSLTATGAGPASASAAGGEAAADAAAPGTRVLAFKTKAPAPAAGFVSAGLAAVYSGARGSGAGARAATGAAPRHISNTAERILDAPELVDDYYLNLLDWGQSSNVLAVALGPAVYLWNAGTGAISELMSVGAAAAGGGSATDDYITSVSWCKEAGNGYLAIGTAGADVQVWDVEKGRQLRSMRGHGARVGALDWAGSLLSSGSRDAAIFNHDVRVREHHVATLAGHAQEVCSLKWSPDGATLASGSNDNTLCLWDAAASAGARACGRCCGTASR